MLSRVVIKQVRLSTLEAIDSRVGRTRLSEMSSLREVTVTVVGIIRHRKALDEKSSGIFGGAFHRAVRTFHSPTQRSVSDRK